MPSASGWLGNLGALSTILGLPTILIWSLVYWVRERRKNRVETKIIEGTADDKIKTSSVTAAESAVALVEKAFNAERASLERQVIAERTGRLEAEAKAIRLHEQLTTVQAEMEGLKNQVERLQRQLADALDKLAELLSADEGDPPFQTEPRFGDD